MCKNSKRFTKFRFHLNLGKFEGRERKYEENGRKEKVKKNTNYVNTR